MLCRFQKDMQYLQIKTYQIKHHVHVLAIERSKIGLPLSQLDLDSKHHAKIAYSLITLYFDLLHTDMSKHRICPDLHRSV